MDLKWTHKTTASFWKISSSNTGLKWNRAGEFMCFMMLQLAIHIKWGCVSGFINFAKSLRTWLFSICPMLYAWYHGKNLTHTQTHLHIHTYKIKSIHSSNFNDIYKQFIDWRRSRELKKKNGHKPCMLSCMYTENTFACTK